MSQILGYFKLFSQIWIARRATSSKLTKPQNFPLEKPRGSNSGLKCSLVFWMSLYKDYYLAAFVAIPGVSRPSRKS